MGELEKRLFADAADGKLDELSLLEATLIASGATDPMVLRKSESRMAKLAADLQRSGKLSGSQREQARVVFEFMHERLLQGRYDLASTDLRVALSTGRFNCVSASVLFNCLATEVGLTVCGLEVPGHAKSRVFLPQETLDLETTCPDWFRLMHDPKKQAELIQNTLGRQTPGNGVDLREISPVQMAAMVYYNRGVDLLAHQQYAAATDVNTKAVQLDSANPTAWGNLLATLNNWAIALASASQFGEAIVLLEEAMALDSTYETFALNYVHIHHQWIEHLCGDEQFAGARSVLDRASARMPEAAYFHRAGAELDRRWAVWLLRCGQKEAAFDVLARGRSRSGNDPKVLRDQIAAVHGVGWELFARGRYEETVQLFDTAIGHLGDTSVSDGPQRRTDRKGASPVNFSLHDSLRSAYKQWIAKLRADGHRDEAARVRRRAAQYPYLRQLGPGDGQ